MLTSTQQTTGPVIVLSLNHVVLLLYLSLTFQLFSSGRALFSIFPRFLFSSPSGIHLTTLHVQNFRARLKGLFSLRKLHLTRVRNCRPLVYVPCALSLSGNSLWLAGLPG
jgi:hypothetical protein